MRKAGGEVFKTLPFLRVKGTQNAWIGLRLAWWVASQCSTLCIITFRTALLVLLWTLASCGCCEGAQMLNSNCCSQESLLHFGLRSSHLNISYYHQDRHRELFYSSLRQQLHGNRPMPLLLIAASCNNNACVSVTRLSAIRFRGQSVRQVSRHTFL